MQNSMGEAEKKPDDKKRPNGKLSPVKKNEFNLPGVSKAKSAARDKKPGLKSDGLPNMPGNGQEKE